MLGRLPACERLLEGGVVGRLPACERLLEGGVRLPACERLLEGGVVDCSKESSDKCSITVGVVYE